MCDALLENPTSGPVCASCWLGVRRLVPPLCGRCGAQVTPGFQVQDGVGGGAPACARCRHDPPPLAMSRTLGDYDGALRSIIHAMKYDGHRSVAARLAADMRAHCSDVLEGADAVVPVPLHWRRRWQRGFNQAALMAAGLGPAVWPALRRVRFTRPQVALPAEDRRRNIHGAFALARGPVPGAPLARRLVRALVGRLRLRRPQGGSSWSGVLRGSVVVLVDDVVTTGATLEACRRVLVAAGVREVRALTAARVPGRR